MRNRTPRGEKKGWPQERQQATPAQRNVVYNAPFPGCCKPYPDVRYANQKIVTIHLHHQGERCGGYREPVSLEDWNAEVDARRPRVGDEVRGDER